MRRKKIDKTRKQRSLYTILVFVFFVGLIFLIFSRVKFGKWDGINKFCYISKSGNGDILLSVLDPKFKEVTNINIPKDTEVDVSRGYGTMKIGNVYQLGINEKVGGALLTETITKNFFTPVTFYWFSNDVNIGLFDRLKITLFIKKIPDIDKTEIDLAKSQFVKKATLTDGSSGYKLNGPVSTRLTSYFSDNKLFDQNLKIKLIDNSGKSNLSERVGGIIEVVGGKVVSIERGIVDNDLDCLVEGKSKEAVGKISGLFGCKIKNGESSFDLEFLFGGRFYSRF